MKFDKWIKKKSFRDYFIYSLIIWLGILADQITKFLATRYLQPIETKPLIDGVLHFTYVENRGAAFGMLANAPWVFNTISIIAITAMIFYLFLGHASNMVYASSISLLISGGIGNMIDRLTLNYVVDFIDFRLIDFAVFNVADSFVCIGCGILILALILDIVKESKRKKSEVDSEKQ